LWRNLEKILKIVGSSNFSVKKIVSWGQYIYSSMGIEGVEYVGEWEWVCEGLILFFGTNTIDELAGDNST
jgi:hypothetical protein